MDNYESIGNLPFPALVGALSIDLSRFKQREGGAEFYVPCPIHNPSDFVQLN